MAKMKKRSAKARRTGRTGSKTTAAPLTSLFVVEPGLLSDLDAKAGTTLLSNLLRCEAARLSLPLQRVVISSRTSAKDGGIDAKVEQVPADASLLKKGNAYFQIKTGASFKPWLKKHLLKELFGSSTASPSKARLGGKGKRCREKKAHYTLVTLGHDLLPQEHSDAVELLTQLFKKAGYRNPRVEVLGQGQLAGLLASYPSLCLDLNGLGDSPFLSLKGWTERADMKGAIKLGEPQTQFIDQLRSAWRSGDFQHLRVIGEPGIGKTRLVLEAASTPDLGPCVIYVPHAEDFQKSSLFNELLKPDRTYTAHLVIDECEERERASIWSALKGKPHIKLITIDHGPELSSDIAMQVYSCPPLGKDQIIEILSTYIGKRVDLSNWAEWCEGSPRVAHAVGDNLKRNPDDILKSPATVPIWERFVLGHQRMDSQAAREHLITMRHLALFQRFGFEDPVSEEAQFLSAWIREADPNITWARFQSIVQHHRDRRVLQGRHTLFIVPKALHVHLWVQFWNQYGRGFNFKRFMERLPKGLKSWFLRLFIYAHASPVAQKVVKEILDPASGPFADRAFLKSDLGTDFINYLAEADQAATLNLLEQTFGRWSLDELRAWTSGRQDIVWALEKIAVWKELFPRAATVLTRLALAENSNYGNNSKGTLKGLFNVGPSWAATQAPPQSRFSIVERLVRSSDAHERALGLELSQEWLSTSGGSRIIGAEYQGMRPTLEFWHPPFWQEVFDAWMSMWRFLHQESRQWPDNDRRAAATVLIGAGMALAHIGTMAAEVMTTLFELADDSAVNKAEFVAAVVGDLRHPLSEYPPGIKKKMEALDKKLTGTSFWDRFSRFVLFTTFDEDHIIKGNAVTDDPATSKRVETLAVEVSESAGLLHEHLPRFLSHEGHRLPQFGYALAKQLGDYRLDSDISSALKAGRNNVNSEFVGGYLAAAREMDFARWERLVLDLLDEPDLQAVVVNATFRSGISSKVIEKLLSLYRTGRIKARAFSRIGLLASQSGIPQSLIDETINALIDRGEDEDVDVSIELTDYYYCREERPLPNPQTRKLIAAAVKLESSRNTMRNYYMHRIVKRYRAQYPEDDLTLLSSLLGNFDSLSRLRGPYDLSLIADEIVRNHPADAWPIIQAAMESQPDVAYDIVMWLGDSSLAHRGAPGAMRLLNADDIIRWTREKPGERVHIIYHGLPKTLDEKVGGRVTQLFIEVFGSMDRVTGALMAHFAYSGAWSGPRSLYLRGKRDEARGWIGEIKSPAVEEWVAGYIATLSQDIELAEIEEERGF
jgi:hypothetical protein